MKFAVGVTLFHPEPEDIQYINTLNTLFGEVYLYDNSEDNSSYADMINSACVYHFAGNNDGLSRAFNWCLDNAQTDGVDQLLLLDQDSRYDMGQLEKLMQQICREEPDETVAIRAGNVSEPDGRICCTRGTSRCEVDAVITSGSILDVATIQKHSLRYEEELFVDHVDHEFCRQVKQKGLKIICYNEYVLVQQLGYLYRGRICHSAVRHYYMVRDLGYFNRKYYGRTTTFYRSLRYLCRDILISLKEDHSFRKIVYAFRGFLDYLANRHGEYKMYHR